MSGPKISLYKAYNSLLIVLAASLSLSDKMAPIIIMLLALFSVMLRVKHKIYYKPQIISYLFFAIFFYYVVRLYDSHNLVQGFKFVEKNLVYFIIPIVVIPSQINNINNVYKGFVLSFSLVSVYTITMSLIHFLFFSPENTWYFQNIEDYGFHPTYMGLYAIINIIILDRKKVFNKKINLLFIGINILFIVFTASRIAILALLVIFLFRVFYFRNIKYIFTLILVTMISISFYFISNDFQYKIDQLSTFKGLDYYDNNDYGSVSVRVAKIMAANNVWKDNFWFGYGTGGLNDELNKQYRSKEIECWPCSQRRYNPHNQYLSILAGHGLFGFLLFLFLIGYISYHTIKYKNYMVLEFILAFLVFGLTESILERQKGVLLFVFLIFYSFSNGKCLVTNENK